MDKQVEKVVATIAEAFHPERVILFGSRASGTADPESDIDLLVLYGGAKSQREVQIAIHRLFAHPDFSLDVFVLRPEQFETQRRIANTLAREADEHGVVCYG